MASRPGDYTHFKSIVPLNRVSIGTKLWRYYDHGPKSAPPLICLPGTAGTADVFYKQILSLSSKGYRVIAADAPPVWSHQEWVNSFEKFLDTIAVHHVHIYGTSLGGFLAQLFAHYRPRRVKSLVLSNTFLDTREFAAATTWSSLINWTPEFLLKRYILSGIRDGPQEPLISDSIDFIVMQLETLSREELASRLTLNTAVGAIGQILVEDSAITVMDTNDYCAIPQSLRDEVGSRYPGARKAVLKTGGDFPFLSRPDEVNLHLQLHLRRVGVEGIAVSRGPASKDRSGDSARGDGGIDSPQQPNQGMPPASGSGSGEGSSPSSSSSSTYGQQVMLDVGRAWNLQESFHGSSWSMPELTCVKSVDIGFWLCLLLLPLYHVETSVSHVNTLVRMLQAITFVWTTSREWYLLNVVCSLLLKYPHSLHRILLAYRCTN